MASDIYEKLSDLRSAQTETHTLVKVLADKVNKYIEADDLRHQEFVDFRLESSKHLAKVATIVQDIKKEVNDTVNVVIPKIQQEQATHSAQLRNHSWLIRAVVGTTLLAVLGGTVTSLATCEDSNSKPNIVARSDGDNEE